MGGCLRIVALKPEHLTGTKNGAIAHLLYHLARGGGACLLGDPLRRDEEFRGMASVPPFVDLVQENMFAVWGSHPIFLWTDDEKHVLDLVMGRTLLFVQCYSPAPYDILGVPKR